IFKINGSQSDKDERIKAAQYLQQLEPGDDDFKKTIFKLSDASGHLELEDQGIFSKGKLDSNDGCACNARFPKAMSNYVPCDAVSADLPTPDKGKSGDSIKN
ncbi:unnamed protein product, partial [Porites lobata]